MFIHILSQFVGVRHCATVADGGKGEEQKGRAGSIMAWRGRGGSDGQEERRRVGKKGSKRTEKAAAGTPLNGENSRSPAHRGDFVRMPQKKNKFFEKVVQQFLTNLLTF